MGTYVPPLPPQLFLPKVGNPPVRAVWLNAVDNILQGNVPATGPYNPSIVSGQVQVTGPGGNLISYGDMTFALQGPNPSGSPCPVLFLGGAGKIRACLTTDAQIPGLPGLQLIIAAGESDDATQPGGELLLLGGAGVSQAGALTIGGGTSLNGQAGITTVRGGNSTNGIAGNLYLTGGLNGPLGGGSVHLIMTTTGGAPGNVVIRVNSTILYTITPTGAIFIGAAGAGAPGYALISGGPNASPVWAPTTGSSSLLYPQTSTESSVGVTPTNFSFSFGDLRRYGATGGPSGIIPVADDSAAWASAVACGYVVIPQGMAFRIVTGATCNGQIHVYGFGVGSQIYNDSAQGVVNLLTVTNGDYSYLHDFFVGTITPPLTIQRYVQNVVNTTATTAPGNPVIVVANATGILVGMQVFGDNTKIWDNSIVTNVAGTSITLSRAAIGSPGSGVNLEFQSITFNTVGPYTNPQGVDPITTLANSTAAGRQSPTVNDADVWPRMSAAQQAAAQIGGIISISGNNVIVERLTGQGLSIQFLNGSNCEANHNILRGGWLGANIEFFMNSGVKTKNNRAIGNVCSDHGFEGIAFMGCDGCTLIGNTSFGVGESGFKLFPDNGNHYSCTGVTSIGNQAIACFQVGFDYSMQFPAMGSQTVMGTVQGDVCRWNPNGAYYYNGSGWNITGIVSELNSGPGLIAVISDSIVSGLFRENNYNSSNTTGAPYNVQINGANNIITGMRVFNETSRNPSFQVAVTTPAATSTNENLSTSLTNCDFRDAVTPANNCLLLQGGLTHLFNVRTNGNNDTPMWSPQASGLIYGPSITPDFRLGNSFSVIANNAVPFTVNAPVNTQANGNTGGQRMTVRIVNATAGVLGAVTWTASYKLAAWASPAANSNRSIEFENNGGGVWFEISRTAVDVPN